MLKFHCRPHFSRFAVEVAKGKMAGLVPDSWAGNGFMEATTLILLKHLC